MNELTAPDQVEMDSKIFELRDTLKSVLTRYQNLSFIETPEWDFTEEIPVRDARRLLRRDKYSKEIYEEFFALRRLARAVRRYRKYLDILQEIEDNISSIESSDLEITEEELETKVAEWLERMFSRLEDYLQLKA